MNINCKTITNYLLFIALFITIRVTDWREEMKEEKRADWKEKWMEKYKEKIQPLVKEIGFFRMLLIVLAGILLLYASADTGKSVPDNQKVEQEQETYEENTELDMYIENMEMRLEHVLSNVQGIGEVEVMITAKSSKEKVALKDTPYGQSEIAEEDGEGGNRETLEYNYEESTVIERTEEGEVPYITKEMQPEIEGVLVLAQGAENDKMVAEINEAVVALFDVPSHKIKVMKRK